MTALGGVTVLSIVTLSAIAVLLIHRKRAQALIFGVAVVVAQLAAELIKAVVARPRPDLVSHLDLTYSSSFPSGHSVMSPVVYFTLAVIIAETESHRAARILLVAGAAALVISIGASRVWSLRRPN